MLVKSRPRIFAVQLERRAQVFFQRWSCLIHRGNRGQQQQQKALFEKTVSSQHRRKLIIGFASDSVNHGGNLLTKPISTFGAQMINLGSWLRSGYPKKIDANQRAHMPQRYAGLKLWLREAPCTKIIRSYRFFHFLLEPSAVKFDFFQKI